MYDVLCSQWSRILILDTRLFWVENWEEFGDGDYTIWFEIPLTSSLAMQQARQQGKQHMA